MLTKDDLRLIDERLDARIKALLMEITELFVSTNKRIDKVEYILSKKIDKILVKLDTHQSDIENHERRLEKLEEKVTSN